MMGWGLERQEGATARQESVSMCWHTHADQQSNRGWSEEMWEREDERAEK